MPEETVYITELETAVLRVFMENKIFKDSEIVPVLKHLIEKLEK